MAEKQLNILMYPWLAMGHITPYFQIAINFAEKGHKVTLLLPNKAKAKLPSENPHPSLLTLHGITVPHVDPLPLGTEINSEVSYDIESYLFTALDLVRPEFESIISSLEPNLVFYDFAYWVPDVVAKSGVRAKSVFYMPVPVTGMAHVLPLGTKVSTAVSSETPAFPSTEFKYLEKNVPMEGLPLLERVCRAAQDSDIFAFKTYREIEGKYCDFIANLYKNKPALLAGMYHSEPTEAQLEARWAHWLEKFGPASVVFCSFGSQLMLNVANFQELLLGLELTNLPFLAALKPPQGCASVEEAFPEGFLERTKGRGLVTGEWVPQVKILSHPSVGCFVSHCGSGGVAEALMMSRSQLVLIPFLVEQVLFTNLATQELKIAVEVKRSGASEGSWSISQHDVCNAIKSVMDDNSEIGELVRHNLETLRQKIVKPGYMTSYVDNFIKDLQVLAP